MERLDVIWLALLALSGVIVFSSLLFLIHWLDGSTWRTWRLIVASLGLGLALASEIILDHHPTISTSFRRRIHLTDLAATILVGGLFCL